MAPGRGSPGPRPEPTLRPHACRAPARVQGCSLPGGSHRSSTPEHHARPGARRHRPGGLRPARRAQQGPSLTLSSPVPARGQGAPASTWRTAACRARSARSRSPWTPGRRRGARCRWPARGRSCSRRTTPGAPPTRVCSPTGTRRFQQLVGQLSPLEHVRHRTPEVFLDIGMFLARCRPRLRGLLSPAAPANCSRPLRGRSSHGRSPRSNIMLHMRLLRRRVRCLGRRGAQKPQAGARNGPRPV